MGSGKFGVMRYRCSVFDDQARPLKSVTLRDHTNVVMLFKFYLIENEGFTFKIEMIR